MEQITASSRKRSVSVSEGFSFSAVSFPLRRLGRLCGAIISLGKTDILKKINVAFEEGIIHGLIGRNGSGKTMLMKCICGFIKPTSGEITVDGKRVGKDVDFPKDMEIIIETPGFIPYYSGYKNLKLLAGLNNKIGKEEVRNSMKQVGLWYSDRISIPSSYFLFLLFTSI